MPGPAVQAGPDPVRFGQAAADQPGLDHVGELRQARCELAVERADQPGGFDVQVGLHAHYPVAEPATYGTAFVSHRDGRDVPLDDVHHQINYLHVLLPGVDRDRESRP